MNLRLKAALNNAAQGLRVLLVKPNGKAPATKNGVKDATTNPGQIKKWFEQYPDGNVGIAMGNGLLALDIDNKNGHDGEASLKKLMNGHEFPATLEQRTPSGGRHLIFSTNIPIRNSANKLGDGLDVRGDGGYIVVPPSVIDGKCYERMNPGTPIAEVPAWLVDLIAGGAESKLDLNGVLNGTSRGARNDQMFRYACKLRKDDVPLPEARRLVLDAAARCIPPLDPEEALICLASAWRYEPSQHLTDLGNARRFVVRHGADVRFVPEFKKWFEWNGVSWPVDDDGAIMRRTKETAHSIYAEAAEEKSDSQRAALSKWAVASESERRLKAIVELAKTEPGIPVRADALDADPWLLGTKNGVIDLKNGVLRVARRDDYITKHAPVEFRPGAECPLFLKFLDRIFAGNVELIGFVQRALGYSMTGDTSEQCLFMPWGGGQNGKSTLLGVIQNLLGDYAMQTDPTAFMARDRGGANNDIARLRGARMVSAIETEEGQRLAESLIKQITGQDVVAARFLYGEYFEYKPTLKLWLAVNHKPVIRGDDYAIWRRIKLIPFNVTIPEDERDKKLDEKLLTERPGILNWLIEGCRAWQRQGLMPPAEVKSATNAYRSEQDTFSGWLDDCCVIQRGCSAKTGALYGSYAAWAKSAGEFVLPQRRFAMKMQERGFVAGRNKTGRFYTGVGLKDDQSEEVACEM